MITIALSKPVEDEDVALPAIDVAGEGPSPIPRHHEESAGSEAGDMKR